MDDVLVKVNFRSVGMSDMDDLAFLLKKKLRCTGEVGSFNPVLLRYGDSIEVSLLF